MKKVIIGVVVLLFVLCLVGFMNNNEENSGVENNENGVSKIEEDKSELDEWYLSRK
ncbi:hypothetical protein [Virgibacillus sp. DJP39]|uniref:hypothetical protein n=1 Tax=Virgibacillus sp. DJP39 TaxID=3409790 RepID=UPI003BB54FC3